LGWFKPPRAHLWPPRRPPGNATSGRPGHRMTEARPATLGASACARIASQSALLRQLDMRVWPAEHTLSGLGAGMIVGAGRRAPYCDRCTGRMASSDVLRRRVVENLCTGSTNVARWIQSLPSGSMEQVRRTPCAKLTWQSWSGGRAFGQGSRMSAQDGFTHLPQAQH